MSVSIGDASRSALGSMRHVLRDLSYRIRRDEISQEGEDAGYIDVIDVVGDLGRVLVQPDVARLRDLLPEIASVREALEEHNDRLFGSVARTPRQALQDPKLGTAYAAGALWACSSIAMGFVDALLSERRQSVGRASRADVRGAILHLIARRGPIRPADVQHHLDEEGLEVHATTVSRALTDLIESGHLKHVSAPRGGDRRARYYGAASGERPVDDEVRVEFRAMLQSLRNRLGGEVLKQLVQEETEVALSRARSEPMEQLNQAVR